MRLLVSVADADDAAAAVVGGADIIDAKDPMAGPLGAVTIPTFLSIRDCVAGTRPVSAALGDPSDWTEAASLGRAFASRGAAFVKIGFAGIDDRARAMDLLRATVDGVRETADASDRHCDVVAVAYADAIGPISRDLIGEAALNAGASGVLLDTMCKSGPGLRALVDASVLADWVAALHAARLTVALAGRLTIDDLPFVHDSGADIAGIRGAACTGGRAGRVAADKVVQLREKCRGITGATSFMSIPAG
jgi:uncharacterized protein (UPF0264 family)